MQTRLNNFKIFLHGHRPDIHSRFSQNGESFEIAMRKIKDLVKNGHKDEIILNTDVHISDCQKESNYFRLNAILKIAKRFGIKRVQLNLINPSRNGLIAPLDEVASYISKARYVFLFDFLTKVKGFPYCLIPEPQGVILKSERPWDFVKFKKCKICRYYRQCDGILKGYINNLDKNKIKPQTLPIEVMIEVTPLCNFHCKFCFNRASFAKKGHHGEEPSSANIKKIICAVKKAGIPIIRFTGGEPLLRKDIYELIRYAKEKKLKVRLNTNCSLIKNKETAVWLAKNVDYVLVSMHTYDSQKEDEITGFHGCFGHKIKVMKWLKRSGLETLRVSTIGTWDNIRHLDEIYKILVEVGADEWAVNRIIPLPGRRDFFSLKQLKALAKKLVKIRKDIVKKNISLKAHIDNGVPLCADDPILMNSVSSGGRSVDGHERFAVDPRGFAKPIYYLEKNIGNPLKPLECWDHPFMKKMRDYTILPRECKKCVLLEKCKGGNRFCAYVAYGNYRARDPLMNFSNIKNFNF
jgi:MoaA/NifB/PqqE/SkfB family radical SAM enzyme